TPTANGCVGTPKTYTVTVNPTPTVSTTLSNITACNTTTVSGITLSSATAGTTYSWTNSNTSIGLAASGTGNLPSFTATNTTASPISGTIVVTPTANGCVGTPKTYTVTVRPLVVVGVLSGNPYVCSGSVPQTIKSTATTGGTGTFTYQWQSSSDNVTWTNIAGATAADYTPTVISQDTYFRRVSNDICGAFNSTAFKITLVPQGVKFTWKATAANSDWNNPNNWINSGGLTNAVPTICSEVHIPGNATKYPSLDGNTVTTTLGDPKADKIIFHYGGQLAYPHKLTYNRAFIQYNWGYYNGIGLTNGAQPTVNGDASLSAPFMKRDNWYMLAAPLKKMASGDFAMAGYPLTWQSNFVATATPTNGGPVTGDFSSPLAKNDIDLSTLNNALAIKVAVYKTGTSAIGYNNHRDLEGLKGILEIPFFDNAGIASFHAGHFYDKYSKQSRFFYFDTKTLQQLNSPIGTMKREAEAYRFIFENANSVTPAINVTGSTPVSVPGYELQINSPSQRAIMIGNPFMASINTQKFFDANSTLLKQSAGYYVFSGTSQTWKQFTYSSINNVGPLQAFVVTLADGVNTGTLKFPLEGTFALTGAGYTGSSRIAPSGRSLFVTIGADNDDSSNYAILSADMADGITSDVKKIIYPEGHITPEVFFVGVDNKDYNLLQVYNSDVKEVKLGVKTSDLKNEQILRFDNISEFVNANGVHPILVDKLLGVRQNLATNKMYKFYQKDNNLNTQYADINRFVLQFTEFDNDNSDLVQSISIKYVVDKLIVESSHDIYQVQVFDLLGRKVYDSGSNLSNTTIFEKYLALSQGAYIVKVHVANGDIKVAKVMAQ
ncbi:MAG: T9SS type A sorting domain-containing protein, partial [Dysgonomonas sp.]